MRAELVDPRYVVEEDPAPVYRVDFQERAYGATEEYRVLDAADVSEVQRWAAAHVGDRDATIWVEYPTRDGVGMARLQTIAGV